MGNNLFLENNSIINYDNELINILTKFDLIQEESKALSVQYKYDYDKYSNYEPEKNGGKKNSKLINKIKELINKVKEFIKDTMSYIKKIIKRSDDFIEGDSTYKVLYTNIKLISFKEDTDFPLFDFQCMHTFLRNCVIAIDKLYKDISEGKTLQDDYIIDEFVKNCTNKKASTSKELYDYISMNMVKNVKIKANKPLPHEVVNSILNYAKSGKKQYLNCSEDEFFIVSNRIERYCIDCEKLILQEPANLRDIQQSISFLNLFNKEIYILLQKLFKPYSLLSKRIYRLAIGLS